MSRAPASSRRLASLLGGILGLSFAACGDGTPTCPASCGAGRHCDIASGACVADPAPIADLAMLPADLSIAPPRTCQPACAGEKPVCNQALHCVGCAADKDCPTGQVCDVVSESVAFCAQGCSSDDRCPTGKKCCDKICVDVQSDALHCGACGTACSVPHATVICAAGACRKNTCVAGWGDCNGDPTDGCETNLRTDARNCTVCGNVCVLPQAVAMCADGCYLGSCEYGYDNCNGDPASGCETSILTNARNCGGCGVLCQSAPHANVSCESGACNIASCTGGYLDCDRMEANGCEIVGLTDKNNCGACGNACAVNLVCKAGQCTCPQCNAPNASSRCVNNICLLDKCNAGYADCDGDQKNGCEIGVLQDPKNCGGCNVVCGMQAPVCDRGNCAKVPGPIIYYDAADPNSYAGNGFLWKDLSGFGVDGTLINNISYGTLGKVKTLIFDGAGAGATFPNATLDQNTFGAIYWVYSQVPQAQADQGGLYINWAEHSFNPPNWVAFFKWSVDDWYFRVNNGACCQDLPGSGKGGFAANVPQNQWTMVHFFYSLGAQNGWKWGANGQNVAVGSIQVRNGGQAENTSTIGWGHAGQGGYWIGGISSVRFYNVLLTDDQIAAIYGATKSGYGL